MNRSEQIITQAVRDQVRRQTGQIRRNVGKRGDKPDMVLQIIGGNTATIGGGLEGIAYAATCTPSAVYDPEVDTVYPAGLGRGYLYVNGIQQPKRVLIRHNFAGAQFPLLAGTIARAPGSTTVLTYSGTDMTAYLFDWV